MKELLPYEDRRHMKYEGSAVLAVEVENGETVDA